MKQRNTNFELLRIVCMLMIIGGHVIGEHDTLFSLSNPDEIIKLLLMGSLSVAVDSFILISGYFGIRYNVERLFGLASQTVFYSLGLTLLAIFLGWHILVPKTDVLRFFPILFKQYWFITCYVVLYIISPLLNKWAVSMEKSEFRRILIIGFSIIYLWPTLNFMVNAPQFINDSGYGIVNFAYLYLFGRYIRIHYQDSHSSSWYWGGYFTVVIMLFICQCALSWVLEFEFTSWFSYNTVFIFWGAVCLFMAFKNIHFHSGIINYCAKPCVAVYLIHLHPDVWRRITQKIEITSFHGMSYILILLLLPVAVYLVCAIIEICRIYLMRPFENWIYHVIIKEMAPNFAFGFFRSGCSRTSTDLIGEK